MRLYLDCSKAGKCCFGFIPLTREEFIRFYDRLVLGYRVYIGDKKTPYSSKIKNLYVSFSLCFIADDIIRCEFLQKDGKCGIYQNRPIICKLFPIVPSYKNFTINNTCSNCGGKNCFNKLQGEPLIVDGKLANDKQKLLKKAKKEMLIQYNFLFKDLLKNMIKEFGERVIHDYIYHLYENEKKGLENFLDIFHSPSTLKVALKLIEKSNVNAQDFIQKQINLRIDAVRKGYSIGSYLQASVNNYLQRRLK